MIPQWSKPLAARAASSGTRVRHTKPTSPYVATTAGWATEESDQKRDVAYWTRESNLGRPLGKDGRGGRLETIDRGNLNDDEGNTDMPFRVAAVGSPCEWNRNRRARVIRAIALVAAPGVVVAVGLVLAPAGKLAVALVRDEARHTQRRSAEHRRDDETGEESPTHDITTLVNPHRGSQ